MHIRRTVTAATLAALVAAGCGGGAEDNATASEPDPPASTTETTAASSTTEADVTTSTTAEVVTTAAAAAGSGELPDTPISGAIVDTYDFQGGRPDPDLLPAPPGQVEVHWYRAGEVYAVVYQGLDAEADACPGNSAFTGGTFEFVSNAEMPNASCPDFPTRIENTDEQGVRICDGRVAYLTLIPSTTAGTLIGTIERPAADVMGVGMSLPIEVDDPSVVPEIDPAVLSC